MLYVKRKIQLSCFFVDNKLNESILFVHGLKYIYTYIYISNNNEINYTLMGTISHFKGRVELGTKKTLTRLYPRSSPPGNKIRWKVQGKKDDILIGNT